MNKWQRSLLKVAEALLEGASKCEHITGTLFRHGWTDDDVVVKPSACALGMIYVDGKNVARIRSIEYDKVYKEHPVLRTLPRDDDGGWDSGIELGDHIITMNDSYGLEPKEIARWLRRLARRTTVPKHIWPKYGISL